MELKTINMQRGEIIAKHFVADREAPTPGQVSREERIFLPFLEAALIGRRLPLDLTPVLKLASDPEELEQLLGLYKVMGSLGSVGVAAVLSPPYLSAPLMHPLIPLLLHLPFSLLFLLSSTSAILRGC